MSPCLFGTSEDLTTVTFMVYLKMSKMMLENSDKPFPSHIEKYYARIGYYWYIEHTYNHTATEHIEYAILYDRGFVDETEMPGQQLSENTCKAATQKLQAVGVSGWHYPPKKKTGSVMSCRKVDVTAMM